MCLYEWNMCKVCVCVCVFLRPRRVAAQYINNTRCARKRLWWYENGTQRMSSKQCIQQVCHCLSFLDMKLAFFKPTVPLSQPDVGERQVVKMGEYDHHFFWDHTSKTVTWDSAFAASEHCTLVLAGDEHGPGFLAWQYLCKLNVDVIFHRDLCHKFCNKEQLMYGRCPGQFFD